MPITFDTDFNDDALFTCTAAEFEAGFQALADEIDAAADPGEDDDEIQTIEDELGPGWDYCGPDGKPAPTSR